MDLNDEVARVFERIERALSAPLSHKKAVHTVMANTLRDSLQFVYDQGIAVGRSQTNDPTIALLRAELEQASRDRDEAIMRAASVQPHKTIGGVHAGH